MAHLGNQYMHAFTRVKKNIEKFFILYFSIATKCCTVKETDISVGLVFACKEEKSSRLYNRITGFTRKLFLRGRIHFMETKQ